MTAEEYLDLLLSQRYHLCCVVVGCLSIILWDVAIHLRGDFGLMRKTGIHLPQIVYILSRIAILAFLLTEIAISASRISSHCSTLNIIATSLASLHYTLLGLLSLLRIRAMYQNRLWVLRLFTLLWITSSGTSIGLVSFLLDETTTVGDVCLHIKLNVTLQQIYSASRTFHGTCIIVAASRSLALSPLDFQPTNRLGLIKRLKTSVVAKDVPVFSKSLLRRSQWDFLIILTINLLLSIGIAIDRIPLAYRVGILRIAPTVVHCGVCSTFRNIARSRYETDIVVNDLPISFNRNPDVSSLGITIPVGASLNEPISGIQEDVPRATRLVIDANE
ncbi:hypothetical protein PM082_012359 [Marasmius tenuissimus]|nr:hypothetical protein PM082_012359 [Marasmius tenuissimus]